MTDDNTEILRRAAVEVLCAGDKVRALLADQPGMADALLAAAAQKLRPAVENDQKADATGREGP